MEDFGLKLSRINFESKNMKSSHAIQQPFMPPLASPMAHKAAKINEMIDLFLKD